MNKTKIPSKTKIAIWWLFIVGITLTVLTITALPWMTDWSPIGPTMYLIPIAMGLLAISPAILLLIKNQTAWTFAKVILSILLILLAIFWLCGAAITIFGNLLLLSVFIPFLLIILDRKNYFEMVRQRELEKREPGNSE
jgi:hypothetical protein